MRGLTFWRPWLWSICHFQGNERIGPKRIENRPMPPPTVIRGERVALHNGKTWDDGAVAFMRGRGADVPHRFAFWDPSSGALPEYIHRESVIVGTARVYGYVQFGEGRLLNFVGVSKAGALDLVEDPWFFGPYGWLLDEVVLLRRPVPHKGAQGLWVVDALAARDIAAQEQAR